MHIRPHGVAHLPDTLARARAGSTDALGRLFGEHADGLLRLAFRITASSADAEDIVQDVFVGLPEALRHYEERGAFDAWLKRITVRCALMRRRSTGRRVHTSLDEAPQLRASTPDLDARMSIDSAIEQLTPTLRSVFVLHEVEGYTHVEIGSLLGIRPGTSEVRLFRARTILRASLDDRS
jgi:RNA polymerase sigma-70 factor (ECF subfamily)